MNKTIYYFGSGHLDNAYIGVDGGSLIRQPLFEELVSRGWKIKWLGYEYKDRKKSNLVDILGLREEDYFYSTRDIVEDIGPNYTNEDLEEDGVLFIEMRPFESKPGYNFGDESKTQLDLINKFYEKNRLVLFQDQDGWHDQIPENVRDKMVLLKAYETEVNDSSFVGIEKFIWAWKEFNNFNLDLPKIFDTFYCGNVYERREVFKEFYKPIYDSGKKIGVAGNWLRKKYGDRDFALDNFPDNIWLGSTEHWTTLPLVAMSKYVVHVSNPRQQRLGIICIRVFEALMAGVPLFVNGNIQGIENYVDEIQIVNSGDELLEKVNSLDLNDVFKKYKKKMEPYHIKYHTDNLERIIEKYK